MQVRKANPFLATATAVIALESNLGFESQHLLHALKESHLPRWIALAEGPKGTIGLHTTADRKEQYCLLYREVLRQRRIVFSDAFFSLSMEPEEARKRLKEETLNFSVVVEPPKSSFGRVRAPHPVRSLGSMLATDLLICGRVAVKKDIHWKTGGETRRHRSRSTDVFVCDKDILLVGQERTATAWPTPTPTG